MGKSANTKLTYETALEEMNRWLDHKKVKDYIREKNQEAIEELAREMKEGFLILNDDFTLTQKLVFPLKNSDGNDSVSELIYKWRMLTTDYEKYSKGVSIKDSFGLANAIICALTGQPMGIIKKLDGEDKRIPRNIQNFFPI